MQHYLTTLDLGPQSQPIARFVNFCKMDICWIFHSGCSGWVMLSAFIPFGSVLVEDNAKARKWHILGRWAAEATDFTWFHHESCHFDPTFWRNGCRNGLNMRIFEIELSQNSFSMFQWWSPGPTKSNPSHHSITDRRGYARSLICLEMLSRGQSTSTNSFRKRPARAFCPSIWFVDDTCLSTTKKDDNATGMSEGMLIVANLHRDDGLNFLMMHMFMWVNRFQTHPRQSVDKSNVGVNTFCSITAGIAMLAAFLRSAWLPGFPLKPWPGWTCWIRRIAGSCWLRWAPWAPWIGGPTIEKVDLHVGNSFEHLTLRGQRGDPTY